MARAEDNNNKPLLISHGLEGEDDSFGTLRSSLRSRRDRLAKREAMFKAQEEKFGLDPESAASDSGSKPNPPVSRPTSLSSLTRKTSINEYSQPTIDTDNDATAQSLLASSKILSMDDATLQPTRNGRSLAVSIDEPTEESAVAVEGESNAMASMRRSLPASMRSRRPRSSREAITINDDLESRTRTPSRDIINSTVGFSLTESKYLSGLGHSQEISCRLTGNTNSETMNLSSRRKQGDEVDSNIQSQRSRFSPDFNSQYGSDERRASTPTLEPSLDTGSNATLHMSGTEVAGETRQERIARYKELRKAALAARAVAQVSTGREDDSTAYVPRYLRNKQHSDGERSLKDDESGVPYISALRIRRYGEETDISKGLSASSSVASSLSELHIAMNDIGVPEGSFTTASKLTVENLQLHNQLSNHQGPYTSLSRLEESPVKIATEPADSTANRYFKYGDAAELPLKSDVDWTAAQEIRHNLTEQPQKDTQSIMNGNHDTGSVNGDTGSNTDTKRMARSGSFTRSAALTDRLKRFENAETVAKESIPKPGKLNGVRFPNPEESHPLIRRQPVLPGGVSSIAKRFASPEKDLKPKEAFLSDKTVDISPPGNTTHTLYNTQSPLDGAESIISHSDVQVSVENIRPKELKVETSIYNGGVPDRVSHSELVNGIASEPLTYGTERVTLRGGTRAPRPISLATDEPLLDPQLAILLEARKKKAGELPDTGVTAALRSRMSKREEDAKDVSVERSSVAAKASFFKQEQEKQTQAAAVLVNRVIDRTELGRHPSAKMLNIDKSDTEAHRAIGAKRAMLAKKRQRSATQPITVTEVMAAKNFNKGDKSKDDSCVDIARPPRGRLLSVPVTGFEIYEVKNGSPPQKYVRPNSPEPLLTTSPDPVVSPVQSSEPKASTAAKEKMPEKAEDKKTVTNRTKKISVPNLGGSRKASTDIKKERKVTPPAHAADLKTKATTLSRSISQSSDIHSTTSAKAAEKSNDTFQRGSTKRLSIRVTRPAAAAPTDSGLLSPASTASSSRQQEPVTRSSSVANSEDVPSYMRKTASTHLKDRHTTAASDPSEDPATTIASRRRSSSMRDLDTSSLPSYMKPTSSYTHRVEHSQEDTTSAMVESPVAKQIPMDNQCNESGERPSPSFMKPTASSSKKLEKDEIADEEKPKPKRILSPTLPDGDLPSYMKATESYFKKVEHLFDEEEPEVDEKPKRRVSTAPLELGGDFPSFMKTTKSFEAKELREADEPIEEEPARAKIRLVFAHNSATTPSGEMPSFMKHTKAFEHKDKHNEPVPIPEEPVEKRKMSAVVLPSGSEPPSFMKPTKSFVHKDKHKVEPTVIEGTAEKRKSTHAHVSKTIHPISNGGENPSFMKPTKSFEQREKQTSQDMHPEDAEFTPDKKPIKKAAMPSAELESPSYVKPTKSSERKESDKRSGSVDSLDIDGAKDIKKATKKSVGGFLRKTFGLSKGTQSQSSTDSTAIKSKSSKVSPRVKASDQPSYMKATSSSSQHKVTQHGIDDETNRIDMTSVDGSNNHHYGSSTSSDRGTVTPTAHATAEADAENQVTLRQKTTPKRPIIKSDASDSKESDEKPKASIAQRSQSVRVKGLKAQSLLASLHVNGEENWKRRVGEKDMGSFRAGTIGDRLSKIKDNSENWHKKKGQENDSKQFTVEGKLATKPNASIAASPLLPRKEKTPGAAKRASSLKLQRDDDKQKTCAKSGVTAESESPSDVSPKPEPTVVKVPQMDDASDFFLPTPCPGTPVPRQLVHEEFDVSQDDFDHLFVYSNDMLPAVPRIKPRRNQAARSQNPVKALSQRADLLDEYIEVRSDIVEKELQRVNREKVAENATKTALAGLASRENIKGVSLRKTDANLVKTPGGSAAVPFKDLMLLQIKGRRHVETRLVAPSAQSINSGDCFILITRDKIFQWMGEFANLMERSKAADLATYIQSKKDLGCTSAKSVIVIEETKLGSHYVDEFWKLLGGDAHYACTGPPEEDELYEEYMAETNSVYKVVGEDLVPIDDYCGQLPRYDMLNDNELLVFDFGSEVYAWCGKHVPVDKRLDGLKLARMLYDHGYDYSDCDINPLSPLCLPENGGLAKAGVRPPWTLCGKVTANMETVLFKEKFFDWPESSRLIQVKGTAEETPTPVEDLKAVDPDVLLELPANPVTLVLEHFNVGRGKRWTEMEDGIRREYEINTVGIRVWHVSASDYYELMPESYGHFHTADTYVVRWQYSVKQSGVRNLQGALSKQLPGQMGRERCAFFFWQGDESSINEKGASALMTVELDEEKGPQIRVEQDLEPACFLSLFDGHMIIHSGKRDDDEKRSSYKLYVVLHEQKNETCLQEVPCRIESLRSRGVLLLINIRTGSLYLWNGCQSPQSVRENGRHLAAWIAEACPMEVGLSIESDVVITEVMEGSESMEFMAALRSNNRTRYDCLLKSPAMQETVARMFYMSSINSVFQVHEVFCPARCEGFSPFPFVQSQLYRAPQPALFLLDFGEEVFLWQGWWPLGSEDIENVSTGSARSRFTEDRKLALETSLNYSKAKPGKTPATLVVYAGREPLHFINHFASWVEHEEAKLANTKDGRPNTAENMHDAFNALTRTMYSLQELQQRPLPEGVNPNKLEIYLSDEDFQTLIKMSREEFEALPAWKQTNVRKEAGLF